MFFMIHSVSLTFLPSFPPADAGSSAAGPHGGAVPPETKFPKCQSEGEESNSPGVQE